MKIPDLIEFLQNREKECPLDRAGEPGEVWFESGHFLSSPVMWAEKLNEADVFLKTHLGDKTDDPE